MLNLYAFVGLLFVGAALAAPEQGKFSAKLSQDTKFVGFIKTLYKNSTIRLKITNANCEDDIRITWLLRSSTCYGEYETIGGDANPENSLSLIFIDPQDIHNYGTGYYLKSRGEQVECSGENTVHMMVDYSTEKWTQYPKVKPPDAKANNSASSRKRRESSDDTAIGETADPQGTEESKSTNDEETTENNGGSKADDAATTNEKAESGKESTDKTIGLPNKNNRIAVVPHMEPYILIISVEGEDTFSVDVSAEMETPLGYLSAHDYPLKTFYMIMCIVYSFYAVAWLVMSACNFRDLLRVQFWIGGVILLGMIEKAVFYSEYLTINTSGISVIGAVKFAEVVSALKRSLARMLVIIVSLGFGIVKPRLGPMLHRVIGIGILYFILAIIEALVRNDASSHPGNHNDIFAAIPLAVVDSIICWWIFMSLMQTMKTLRLRRNVVKLSLFRHFSNTIIFCIIASLGMIIYSLRYRDACETAWKEKWVDDAFWHILFSIILLVIMVLWRPNVNNQRYSFSPLLDGDAGEGAEEPMLGSGATETVKMRGLKHVSERRDAASNAEDNLRWIEDNIPETIADAALPAIMDSDEEIVATKYEMSKME